MSVLLLCIRVYVLQTPRGGGGDKKRDDLKLLRLRVPARRVLPLRLLLGVAPTEHQRLEGGALLEENKGRETEVNARKKKDRGE